MSLFYVLFHLACYHIQSRSFPKYGTFFLYARFLPFYIENQMHTASQGKWSMFYILP